MRALDAVGAKITDVDHVAVGQDSEANLAKKVRYALSNPGEDSEFYPACRQRKEALRDLRSLLTKALEVDPKTLRFQEHHLEHHIAHNRQRLLLLPVGQGRRFQLRRFG